MCIFHVRTVHCVDCFGFYIMSLALCCDVCIVIIDYSFDCFAIKKVIILDKLQRSQTGYVEVAIICRPVHDYQPGLIHRQLATGFIATA